MVVVREVTGYTTSKDYEKLFELAKEQSVLCLCEFGRGDYKCMDIAHTIWSGTLMKISARGTVYVWADTLEYFVEQCKTYGVEWIPPNHVDADQCSLFHPIRGVCGAGSPDICGHCGKYKNEHD